MSQGNIDQFKQLNDEMRQMMTQYGELFQKFGGLLQEVSEIKNNVKTPCQVSTQKTQQNGIVFEDKEEGVKIYLPDPNTIPNRLNLDINTLKVEVISNSKCDGLNQVDDLINQINHIPINKPEFNGVLNEESDDEFDDEFDQETPKLTSDNLLNNIRTNHFEDFREKVSQIESDCHTVELGSKLPELYGSQLSCSQNQEPDIPFNSDTYGQMCEQLEYLKQQYQLPQEITELYDVKELDLSDWDITSVLKDFEVLYQLEELNLSNNRITSLNFGNMTSLKRLRLSNNQITTIHDSISNLVNLEELYLDGNIIRDITPICKLPKLRILHIQKNAIHDLPDGFSNLTNLGDLHVDSMYQIITTLGKYPQFTNVKFA